MGKVRHPARRGEIFGSTKTSVEESNSVSPVSTVYEPGNCFRYMTTAQIADVQARTGVLDVTAAVQSAIDSGYKAYAPEGTYAIEGTLTLLGAGATGGVTLEMTSGTRLERFTSNTDPILHVYGVQNKIEGNMAQVASRSYTYPQGMILVGGDPDNAYTTADNIATQHNTISDLKLIGSSANTTTAKSPGIYVHSPARKRGNFVGKTTYYNNFNDIYITQVDVGVELSTDANANAFKNISIIAVEVAHVVYNASYANTWTNTRLETPLDDGSATRRYAIHLGEQNSGIETDTSAAYPIGAALHNHMQGFAEMLNTGNQVMSLMTHTVPSGGTYGQNEIKFHGSLPAGTGVDGFSTAAGIGRNHISGGVIEVDRYRPIDYHDFKFRRLDDDSDHSFGSDEYKIFSGRMTGLVESTAYNVITIDNIGTDTACMTLNLSFAGKEGANNDTHGGEIGWLLPVTANTNRTAIKYKDFQANENDEQVTWGITDAAGTTSNTGKFTLTFTTGSVSGTGSFLYTWKVELVTGQLEGTNIDWDADVTIQNGT